MSLTLKEKELVAIAKKVKEVPNQKIYETADKLNAGHSKAGKPTGDACCEGSACCSP